MLNRKTKAILFIFIILFFISAVNAESLNDMDITSVEIMNVESSDYIAAIDDGIGGNSFTDLNTTINGNSQNSSITLDKDYIYNTTSDKDFKNGIIISRLLLNPHYRRYM